MAAKPTTTDVFPFIKLPPELRIRVYEYAIISNRIIDLSNAEPKDFTWGGNEVLQSERLYFRIRRSFQAMVEQPPLSRVSKIVRQETLPIFYGQTTFLLRKHDDAPSKGSEDLQLSARSWVDAIGEANRDLLKSFYIDEATPTEDGTFFKFAWLCDSLEKQWDCTVETMDASGKLKGVSGVTAVIKVIFP